jgi:hypothetical protein
VSIAVKSVAWGLSVYVISLAGLCDADAQEADKKTACEHLVQYMQAARKITGEFASSERAHRLLALKRSYAKKIKHPPENARIATGQWIAALSRAAHKIKSGRLRMEVSLRCSSSGTGH